MHDRALPTAEIADRLALYASLLELAGASPFAVRAYARAAELIRSSPAPVGELVRAGKVRELRGIGPGIEARLRELVETGDIAELAALREELDPELVGYGRLRGITAARMLEISRALGLRTVAEFETAVADGRLREVAGIGPVTEARIRAAVAEPPRAPRGLTLNRSRPLSLALAEALGGAVAGEPRRYCELAHELVVVCPGEDASTLLARLEAHPAIVAILEREARGGLGLTLEGVPVRLVVAPAATFGTALFRATGSAEYVAALEPLPDAPDEDALFRLLGLPYCPPELRERPGAVAPPGLVDAQSLRGDLHCHTTWSDGKATVRELGEAARARGYDYVAVCDHTPNVRVVPGLDADALRRQAEEIAEVNAALAPFRVLRGVECDLRADGSLDVDDDVLLELEWVQLSLHAGQRRSRAELTRIVTAAMRHPAVRALSHPKGRILNHRPENALDLDEVFAVAADTGVALEVNGLPDRLDLSAEHVRRAAGARIPLVLNSDAHSVRGLENVELAVATARKGGVQRDVVVNARPLAELLGRPRGA